MPWYMNPVITCKVLNRLANRHSRRPLGELNSVLDQATQLLWSKQENFLACREAAHYLLQGGVVGSTVEYNG